MSTQIERWCCLKSSGRYGHGIRLNQVKYMGDVGRRGEAAASSAGVPVALQPEERRPTGTHAEFPGDAVRHLAPGADATTVDSPKMVPRAHGDERRAFRASNARRKRAPQRYDTSDIALGTAGVHPVWAQTGRSKGGLTSLRQRGQRGTMRRVYLIATLLFLFLPLDRAAACRRSCAEPVAACRQTECGALDGRARHRCVRKCRARSTCTASHAAIRTLAYVVSECRTDAQGFSSGSQKLLVRRGNCDPITVVGFGPTPPGPDDLGLCRQYGDGRTGPVSALTGLFQHMAVLPDGSGVVVEVTNDHSFFPEASPEPSMEGIFLVRADGSGPPQWLGPALRVPIVFVAREGGASDFRVPEPLFATSPNSGTIAFTDYDSQDALQIFTLDVRSGQRTQLTRLPPVPDPPLFRGTCCPAFADERTIVFTTVAGPEGEGGYRIRTDGSGLERIFSSTAVAGGRVNPEFQIGGGGTNVVVVTFRDEAVNPIPGARNVSEIFLVDGEHALQLTKFHRSDTIRPVLSGRRVFFLASADPFRKNPRQNCQLFSVNTLGSGLRQLTRFRDDGRRSIGCRVMGETACWIFQTVVDPVTRAVGFGSSCDPLGTNPYGWQFFSMRRNGSGLRQLTTTRGRVIEPDGSVSVEMPGLFAYSGRIN